MSGQRLKSIRFKLPIIENDLSIGLDNGEHVEIVCLLGRRKPDDTIKVSVNMDDYYQIRDAEEAEKNPS